ncbi:MAG: RDD family protein, partial [Chloroflexota bacterium]|nr:RDD family protein [Chloroflexota bacterium]
FWVRFLAFLIDGILLSVITAPFAPVWGPHFTAASTNFQVNAQFEPIGTLIGLVYLAGMWAWRGQTIGMMPFNMKVVSVADGKNIDIFRALLRYVGFIIAAIPLLIGLIWAAFDPRKQGWHDKIASTVVIRPN